METLTESPSRTATFLREWSDELARDPENTYTPGVCARCSCSLGANPADWVNPLSIANLEIPLPVRFCNPCIDILLAERKDAERAARDAALARFIPVEFNFWDGSKGNAALLAKIDHLFPDPASTDSSLPRGNYASRRGLLMHGVTGSCKTRLAWQVIKRLICHSTPASWLWCDAFDLATRPIPEEAAHVDWLVIDDLGNEPTSTKYETALLRLIRRRCDWHRPIIITTQLNGLTFKSRFFEGSAGAAVVRRLRERTDMVPAL